MKIEIDIDDLFDELRPRDQQSQVEELFDNIADTQCRYNAFDNMFNQLTTEEQERFMEEHLDGMDEDVLRDYCKANFDEEDE